jgi:hypothetical protein
MEHEEEPNTSMARALFDFARKEGLLPEHLEVSYWDELTDDEKQAWERMAAVSHEAYHKAYEAREQVMPVTVGRHRGGQGNGDLFKDADGKFYSREAEAAYYELHPEER